MAGTIKPGYREQFWRRSKIIGFNKAIREWRSAGQVPGDIMEVGCWEGRSTVRLANEVAPRTVIAIDHFGGNPGSIIIPPEVAGERPVEQQFRTNIAAVTPRAMWTYT